MAVFQNILNAFGKNKATQEREEKKLQNVISEEPQMKKEFERVNRAEKKLQDKKGGIDFKNPWSNYYYDVEKMKDANAKGEKYFVFNEGELKKKGLRKNSKGIDSSYFPSAAIERIRYNPETKNLYITFKGGKEKKEYLYPNVKEKDIQKYLVADSKGRYNYYKIRPKYAVSKEEALRIKQESKNR